MPFPLRIRAAGVRRCAGAVYRCARGSQLWPDRGEGRRRHCAGLPDRGARRLYQARPRDPSAEPGAGPARRHPAAPGRGQARALRGDARRSGSPGPRSPANSACKETACTACSTSITARTSIRSTARSPRSASVSRCGSWTPRDAGRSRRSTTPFHSLQGCGGAHRSRSSVGAIGGLHRSVRIGRNPDAGLVHDGVVAREPVSALREQGHNSRGLSAPVLRRDPDKDQPRQRLAMTNNELAEILVFRD